MHRTKIGRKRRAASEPTPLTRREKLEILGIVSTLAITVAVVFHYSATARYGQSLDKHVARLTGTYRLSPEQARKIRQIEEEFHGKGNPFLRPTRSNAESQKHIQAIAAAMSPEDAARFLQSVRTRSEPGDLPSP